MEEDENVGKKNLFDCYRCCCHCLPVGNVSQRFDFPPVKRSHVIGSLFRPPEASGVTPIGLILPSLGEICPLYQHRWETSRNVFENGPSVALAVSNESIINQQFYLAIFLYKKIFELCGTFLAAFRSSFVPPIGHFTRNVFNWVIYFHLIFWFFFFYKKKEEFNLFSVRLICMHHLHITATNLFVMTCRLRDERDWQGPLPFRPSITAEISWISLAPSP